jgi:hypothetical protein
MPAVEVPPTALMDPWLVVDVNGEPSLFGFAWRHPSTGGLSWMLSTAIVELDAAAGRARTASGRVYQLGRRIEPCELDEEGVVALDLLLERHAQQGTSSGPDVSWVIARKMARHLSLAPPPRDDPEAVERFLRTHDGRYRAALDRRGRF